MTNVVSINIPDRICQNDWVGGGLSSWVLRVDAVAKCYKLPSDRDREIAIYQRLGSHESILQYYGSLEGCILLQYAPHGTVRQYLESSRHNPPLATRLRWAMQVTEAISYTCSKGVFHCDISSNNVFIDAKYNAMVGDFAGSSIDGEEPLGWYGSSHRHPDMDEPSEESEIFALGSTYWEILTGANPFEGRQPAEFENAIRRGDFPTLENLPALQNVISKCWRGRYRTVNELLQEVRQDAETNLCQVNQHSPTEYWLTISLALAIPITWWISSLRLSRN